IVEQEHRGAELAFSQAPGQMAIGAYEHRHVRQRTRQHLRLVTRALDWFEHTSAIAHNDNAVGGPPSCVAATQDRRALPHLEQHSRECGHNRRLPTSADGQVADADDGTFETSPRLRMPFVPRAPHPRHVSVDRAECTHPSTPLGVTLSLSKGQWISRKGRTT